MPCSYLCCCVSDVAIDSAGRCFIDSVVHDGNILVLIGDLTSPQKEKPFATSMSDGCADSIASQVTLHAFHGEAVLKPDCPKPVQPQDVEGTPIRKQQLVLNCHLALTLQWQGGGSSSSVSL